MLPLPELALGNIVRLKKSGRYGIIMDHAGTSHFDEPLISICLWDANGHMEMDGELPRQSIVSAHELLLVKVVNYSTLNVPFDLYPPCPKCSGDGFINARRPEQCPCCSGLGRSRNFRRIHPELLDYPTVRTA